MALLSFAGCQKSIESSPCRELRLHVTMSGGSRVELGDEHVTWGDDDVLTLYRLESGDMYDNRVGQFGIVKESISEDRKSAEFLSQSITLKAGERYIAVTRSTTIAASKYLAFDLNTNKYDPVMDIMPGADQSGSGDDSQLERDLLLASQIFEASYEKEIPTLYFTIEESVLELDVRFKSGHIYRIKSISFEAESSLFSRYIRLNRDGSFGIKEGEEFSQVDRVVSRTLDSAPIGGDYYKILIPVRWSEQAEAMGNFKVTLTTDDNKISTVEIPAKRLEVGTIYQRSLDMDDPVAL